MMSVYAIIGLAIFFYMSVWFLIACVMQRNDIADIAWGLGFVIMSWLSYVLSDSSARSVLVNLLITLWGLRLTWHIAARNLKKPEDHRYALWRATWTYFYVRSFVQIFLLQGLFLFIILLPVLFIHASAPTSLQATDLIGVTLWIIGFFFESVGDRQLRDFLKNPANKGKIMDTGLWAYSRHPNYFGEVMQWWGIFVCAAFLPSGYLTIVSPLLLTFLIVYVSGVPMLEKKYAGRPDFEAYKQRTSMFFPLPPR